MPRLALNLGATTGGALRGRDGLIMRGTAGFRPCCFDRGRMGYLCLTTGLSEGRQVERPDRQHRVGGGGCRSGTDAAHLYGESECRPLGATT